MTALPTLSVEAIFACVAAILAVSGITLHSDASLRFPMKW